MLYLYLSPEVVDTQMCVGVGVGDCTCVREVAPKVADTHGVGEGMCEGG